jgi:hypothetical protein
MRLVTEAIETNGPGREQSRQDTSQLNLAAASASRRKPAMSSLNGLPLVHVTTFLVISVVLVWLIQIYSHALRDPRYLDGWLLGAGMLAQLGLHVAIKTRWCSPKALQRWRRVHIGLGVVLMTVFALHTDFSLPDTVLEWALWTCFVVVVVSGLFGTYLARSQSARQGFEALPSVERLSQRRAELAREVLAIVNRQDQSAAKRALPAPPQEAWIADLYHHHLEDFFASFRNAASYSFNAQRRLKRLTDEIDTLTRYADNHGQAQLADIRRFVIEKDRLDFAHLQLKLARGWLLLHVPVTYALLVLGVLHVVAAYAFSSGVW